MIVDEVFSKISFRYINVIRTYFILPAYEHMNVTNYNTVVKFLHHRNIQHCLKTAVQTSQQCGTLFDNNTTRRSKTNTFST